MKICKYCKKPILDNQVWNPDSEGNGYHHACLCEMEFSSRDRQIYDKGRADVLDKIRAEIEQNILEETVVDCSGGEYERTVSTIDLDVVLEILDKYKEESEGKE